MERYREPRWFYAPERGSLRRTKPDNGPPGVVQEIDIEIPFDQIPSLVKALEENGLLKPRLDERLRTEDLKITHRLIDLLDKSIAK